MTDEEFAAAALLIVHQWFSEQPNTNTAQADLEALRAQLWPTVSLYPDATVIRMRRALQGIADAKPSEWGAGFGEADFKPWAQNVARHAVTR